MCVSRVDVLDAAAAPERLGDVEEPVLVGDGEMLVELVLVEAVLAVGAQAAAAVLQRAHRLAERLLEGAADGHGLAHATSCGW